MQSARNVTAAPVGARAGGLGREFRDFILRGNVVDLAIAVVIGAAFGTIVTAFVKDLITPLIAAIGGKPDFSALYFTINNSRFLLGDFINAVISFLIIAAVIFFFVVKPVNSLMARFRPSPAEPAPTATCIYCKSSIPVDATRCAFCTSDLTQRGSGAGAPAPRR
ncbi:MAG: large conductance mechanosensitive channel protein MscL [Chloroflexota bacterium]